MKRLLPIMTVIVILGGCHSKSKKAIGVTAELLSCIHRDDVKCLWGMSDPSTHIFFNNLANQLNKAKIQLKDVPDVYKEKYIKALMLDKLKSPITGKDLFTYLIDPKGMIFGEDVIKDAYTKSVKDGIIVVLSDGTKIKFVNYKGTLKTTIFKTTFQSLPLYRTLKENLKVFDHDLKVFHKNHWNNSQRSKK